MGTVERLVEMSADGSFIVATPHMVREAVSTLNKIRELLAQFLEKCVTMLNIQDCEMGAAQYAVKRLSMYQCP